MSEGPLDSPAEPPDLWALLWQRSTGWDRAVYLGYVLLFVFGLGGTWALELDDPRLPVWKSFRDPDSRLSSDPWGHAFAYPELTGERLELDWIARSAGPNGVEGDEDDVLVPPEDPSFDRYDLYVWLGRLPWLGMLLVAGWELARLLRRPRADLRTELGLAGLAGIGVGLALAYLGFSLTERGPGRELREQLFRSTLVDRSISVIGSALVAGVLLVFALRGLLAPPAEPAAEPELPPRP